MTSPEQIVPSRTRAVAVSCILAVAIVFTVTLLWAKWLPYAARVAGVSRSHAWTGSSILQVGGVKPGDAPTWAAATSFTAAYLAAIWKALLAALLISAAIQAFIPRNWLLRLLNRRGRVAGAVIGGLLSTPSMMCTCCTAPVAATLKRNGVRTSAAVAYWLGNPLLNPAVLVFLFFVAPWQWTVTRLVIALIVVVGGSVLVERLTEKRVPATAFGDIAAAQPDPQTVAEPTGRTWLIGAPERFGRALLRLSLTLIPEYLLIVLLIGAFRGWIFPIGRDSAHSGLLVVLLAALVGTAMVIPTAGEIPILQGLALAGLSLGGIGALLVTLPAVSAPGMVMLGRSLGWRVTGTTAAVAVAGGLLAGGLLAVL